MFLKRDRDGDGDGDMGNEGKEDEDGVVKRQGEGSDPEREAKIHWQERKVLRTGAVACVPHEEGRIAHIVGFGGLCCGLRVNQDPLVALARFCLFTLPFEGPLPNIPIPSQP